MATAVLATVTGASVGVDMAMGPMGAMDTVSVPRSGMAWDMDWEPDSSPVGSDMVGMEATAAVVDTEAADMVGTGTVDTGTVDMAGTVATDMAPGMADTATEASRREDRVAPAVVVDGDINHR